MSKFCETVHTPDALADQIEHIYQTEPDAYLVGSLGRAVLYGEAYDDPYKEYELRKQVPLAASIKPRDIDLIGTTAYLEDLQPYPMDTVAFNGTEVAIVKDGDDWWLNSEERGFSERLHPAIMEPVQGMTIFDIPCKTLRAQTHLALYRARPNSMLRKHDKQNIKLLTGALGDVELPADMYEPFEQLQRVRVGTAMMLPALYNKYVPPQVDHVLSGYKTPARNGLIKMHQLFSAKFPKDR
jgi:hypothetical protein